ncbi:MAG: hypothetical protein ACFFF4_10970 [Candidatus Thorarchaeota archaeon]
MENDELVNIAKAAEKEGNLNTTLAVIRTIEAEKRTHLAQLRTGIGILTIPMSLLTILIATSEYYLIEDVLVFIFSLIIGIICLSIIGGYLVIDALGDLRRNSKLRKNACVDTESLLRQNNLLLDD